MQLWKQYARHLKAETYALYLAYRDPRTPWAARVFTAIVVGYAFSPIDLIPDFIPVLGYLDDLILVPLGIGLALKMIPLDVMAESRVKAKGLMAAGHGHPMRWIAVVGIVTVWILLIVWGIIWGVRILG